MRNVLALSHRPSGFRSWLTWVAAVTAGWVIGWTVGELVARISADAIWVAFLIQGGNSVGIGVAALQALALRRHLEQAATWILATGVAAVVADVIGSLATGAVYNRIGQIEGGYLWSLALSVLAAGLLVGFAQWLILRRLVARAGWWIPVSGLGLIVGWFVGALVGTFVVRDLLGLTNDLHAFRFITDLFSTTTYAAITGYTLLRLFRSPLS